MVSDNLKSFAAIYAPSAAAGLALAPPQTAAEIAAGVLAPALGLPTVKRRPNPVD